MEDRVASLQRELRCIRAAEGYIMLGMYQEANEELEQLGPERRTQPQTLIVQLCVYAGLEQWDRAQILAETLARHEPDNAQWTLWWASAACRAQSVEAASKILLQALQSHPNNANIHYNLSCYETRLHNFKQAQRHLARAIQLDPRLRFVAADVEGRDLELLWMEN